MSFPTSLTASADDAATLPEMLDQPAVVARNPDSAAGNSLAGTLPAAEPSLVPLLFLPLAHLVGYPLTMAKLTATAAEQGGDR